MAEDLPDVKPLAQMIKQWESGIHVPGPIYRPLYVRVTGRTEEDLFGAKVVNGRVLPRGRSTPHVTDLLSRHCQEDLGPGTQRPQIAEVNQDFLDAVERLYFTPPAATPPKSSTSMRVTAEHVSQIEVGTEVFRNWDNQFGGGLRRKAVIGQLSEVGALLAGPFANDQVRKRMFSAVADLTQLAGFMSFDLRLHASAQRYFMLGLHLAKEVDDRLQLARMMYCLARQMIELDHPRAALDLAQTGLYAVRRVGTPRVAAMLHAVEGRAHGSMGDSASCHRSLGRAAEEFRDDREDPGWAQFFSETELAGITGVALRDLALRHQALGDDGRARVHASQARPWINRAAAERSDTYLRSRGPGP